jgi:hypothetical protein
MLLTMMAGWLNRHHQDVIEFLKKENKILHLVEVCQRNDNQLTNLCFCHYCG